MIKMWEFHYWKMHGDEEHYLDQGEVQRTYHFNMDYLVELERVGFDGVFFTEHHFLNTLSPSPNLLIAAVAQRTKRLRLGTLGNVLCLYQPFRLAEELAMLDYLTDGRLEIGTAPGVPPEVGFLISPGDIHPMYDEIVQILEMAREVGEISIEGEYYRYNKLPSMPRPLKSQRRRHWRAVASEGSAVATAKLDAKLGLGFQSLADMNKLFDTYRQVMADEGHPASPDDIAIRRQVLIWDTDAEAAALQAEVLQKARAAEEKLFGKLDADLAARRQAAAAGGPSGKDAPAAPSGPPPGGGKKPFRLADLVHAPDEYIHGSPRTVAEWIIEQCRQTGAGNFMSYLPNAFSEAEILHQLKLWPQVIEIIRSADVLPKTA